MQTVLWGYLSLSVATPIARQQATRSLHDSVLAATARIQQTLSSMDAMSLQIVVDTQVQSVLQHEARGGSWDYLDGKLVGDIVARTLAWTDTPVVMGVRGPRGFRYGEQLAMAWNLHTDPQFLATARGQDDRSTVRWTNPYASRALGIGGRWIAAARVVPDSTTGATIGMVVAEIPVDQLGLYLPGASSSAPLALALLTPDGRLISGTTDTVPGQRIMTTHAADQATATPSDDLIQWRGTTYVLATSMIGATSWRVVGMLPWHEANLIVSQIEQTIKIAALVAAVLAVLLAWVISSWINRPLQRLLVGIRQIRAGQWATRVPISPPAEVAELSASFNAMAEQIEVTLASLREAQQRELAARLEILSGQINAHFLFNALEVIDCVAYKEGPDAVSRVVLALAGLLRYTMQPSDTEATLADEAQQAEHYLLIQSERFEDLLRYQIEIDPALLACPLPRFVIQPLVENAVKHGMYPARRPCLITVRGHDVPGGDIVLEVEDDGAGLPVERLIALQSSLRSNTADAQEIGLRNVHRRLQLRFGPAAGVEIDARPEGGCVVRLRIPRRSVDKEDERRYAASAGR